MSLKLILILGLLVFINSCDLKRTTAMPKTNTYALRLKPGADLRKSIEDFVREQRLTAAWIATCAGSLQIYNIRFANQAEGVKAEGHFEIVTLAGTLSVNGCHLHISVSDSTGHTIGGHLLEGNIVYTTAELVIQSDDSLIFDRRKDEATGWKELEIIDKKK